MVHQRNCLPALVSLLAIPFIFLSCKKDNSTAVKSRTELLTAHDWKYDEYFRNYNSTTTALYYKRGKANNVLNLDQNRLTFHADGTYTEINETGATINGTWQFLNNETEIETTFPGGTNTWTINLLDDNKFYWFDPVLSNGTFGEMIPQ